jgi:hypothetical protein
MKQTDVVGRGMSDEAREGTRFEEVAWDENSHAMPVQPRCNNSQRTSSARTPHHHQHTCRDAHSTASRHKHTCSVDAYALTGPHHATNTHAVWMPTHTQQAPTHLLDCGLCLGWSRQTAHTRGAGHWS